MTAYAVAHMREVEFGPAIVRYLEEIDATLAPFGGRFRVHGAEVQPLEGDWPGHLILIEFPDLAHAQAWYASPAYREILALRLAHSRSDTILVEGCDDDHKATDILAAPAPVSAPDGLVLSSVP